MWGTCSIVPGAALVSLFDVPWVMEQVPPVEGSDSALIPFDI